MKQITVLFFATLRDHMKMKQISIQLPDDSGVHRLKAILAEDHPQAASVLDSALVAINREYAIGDEFIPDGAEVAFFPHVSGG